eukprot:10039091-Alexandrium_andersonii.AAC.1
MSRSARRWTSAPGPASLSRCCACGACAAGAACGLPPCAAAGCSSTRAPTGATRWPRSAPRSTRTCGRPT